MRHAKSTARIGSVLLSCALLLSLLPTAAFATDGGAEGPIGDTVQTEPGDPSTGSEPDSGEAPTTPSGEGNTSGNPAPTAPVEDGDDSTEPTGDEDPQEEEQPGSGPEEPASEQPDQTPSEGPDTPTTPVNSGLDEGNGEDLTTQTGDAVAQIGNQEYWSLAEAVEAVPSNGMETTITLVADIVMGTDDIVTIQEGQNVVLNMAEKSITVENDFTGRPLVNHGTLTITGDGTIDSSKAGAGGKGSVDNYGTLTIENGDFRGSLQSNDTNIYNRSGGVANFKGGTYDTNPTAIFTQANSITTISGGTYKSPWYPAIENKGTMTITGGTFENLSCYTCDSSHWGYTIRSGNNSDSAYLKIDGENESSVQVTGVQGGVAVVDGTADIYNGYYKTIQCPENDAHTSTFYALYIAGESGEVACNVYGGTYTTEGSHSAVLVGNNNPGGDGGIRAQAIANIYGGTFSAPSGISALNEQTEVGDVTVYAGTFLSGDTVSDVSDYLADTCKQDDNGEVIPLTGEDEDSVASIGNTYYKSLAGAVADAENGQTVTLLQDTEENIVISADQRLTLDLNGKTLSEANSNSSTVIVEGELTIQDSTATNPPEVSGTYYETVNYTSGKITSSGYKVSAVATQNGGTVTLVSGKVESTGNIALYAQGDITGETEINSTVNVFGGYVEAQEFAVSAQGKGATLNISDGVMVGKDNAAVAGNGSNSEGNRRGGTTINISGGTMIGHIETVQNSNGDPYIACGIYHPQSGELNITGGTIYAGSNGRTGVGILMRGGTLEISNATVTATGSISGCVGDSNIVVGGSAVLFDYQSNYYDRANTTVEISSGSFTSDDGVESIAIRADGEEDKATATNAFSISGGTFSSNVSDYCAPGLASSDEDKNGTFEIVTDTSMFQSGNGTQSSPFIIMTEAQLKKFAESVNDGATYEGQYIQLGDDIQLTENWSPMGTFSGTFDGQNHSVTHLNITNGTSYTGFFSHLSGATVRNLKIEHATITCGADCWVGVIAGRADNSTVENCTVSGTITANNVGTSQSGNHGVAAAGVVEYAYQSTISNTTSTVNITVSTTDEIAYAGGIACEVNGTDITGCTNTGSLSASSSTGYSYVGGIAAYMKNSSSITACVNNGTVQSGGSSAAYATAGGIVGGIWSEQGGNSDTIRNSTNTGAVTATVGGSNTDCYAGGIAGEAYQYYADENTWDPDAHSNVSITNCTNSGTVTVSPANENHVGGVLAWGDVEWKMELSGNNPGSYQESGWFSAPAEFTIDGNGGDLGYDANKGWLHVFETLTIKNVTIGSGDQLTVIDGQTLILDETTTLSDDVQITVKPGGTLINNTEDENIDVTGAAASIGNTYYSTLQAAVDAVGNNQTIVLLSNNAEIVTVGRTVTFELNRNGKDFTGEIRPGTNTTITTSVAGDITTYTCVYRTSTGGSSSGGTTRYNVSVEDTDNGSIRVSPSRASRGQTVTITVDPDEGYVLDRLIVRDSDGDRIDLERKSATKYTFEMPRGKVTVEATFVEGEEENVLPFRDVDVDDWFYDAVVYAYENDLMSGVSAREFAPNSTLTRAMVAQILYSLEDKPSVNYLMQYDDVASGDWYAEAVRWATSEGIMSGYSDSQFGPNDAVTRQQLALILYNYAREQGYDTDSNLTLSRYTDADSVAVWAVNALEWAVDAGLISGVGDNVLAPTGSATRAQVAQIFMNFLENVAR